jgi:hypothetical protein
MSILKKTFVLLFLCTAFLAPLIWYPGLSDFSNLPQRVFLETAGLFLALVWLAIHTRNGVKEMGSGFHVDKLEVKNG